MTRLLRLPSWTSRVVALALTLVALVPLLKQLPAVAIVTCFEPRACSMGVIHEPCRGLPGARFTLSSEHPRQKKRDKKIHILSLIVNGNGVDDLRRILRTPRGEGTRGRDLLAYEQAQLANWPKRVERQRVKDGKPYIHTQIAHDDIVVGVNWQTKIDRKITQMNCSVSAEIQSGYVFRCDVDFDPTIDPLEVVGEVIPESRGDRLYGSSIGTRRTPFPLRCFTSRGTQLGSTSQPCSTRPRSASGNS